METIANLESFVRTAKAGSFSEAARQMLVTPAAVSRNVAMLERNLGLRLFQRSTRRLTLTEAGETLLAGIDDKLESLQAAIAAVAGKRQEPAGVLKVSLPLAFGVDYILPLLPAFLERYPAVTVDWCFTNRQVDLIGERFDVGIGGGFDLPDGMIARPLVPAHIIAVASPSYMAGRSPPNSPGDLRSLDGIVRRVESTGRIRRFTMTNGHDGEGEAVLRPTIVLNDPGAMVRAALLGLGVALVVTADVASHLRAGTLIRLAPDWYADMGPINIYYSSKVLLPAKVSLFANHVLEHFKHERLAERLSGAASSIAAAP